MQISTIYLNDFDPARIGLVVESVQGLRDGASMRYASSTAPGVAGNLLLTSLPQMGSRVVTVTGTIRATTAAGLIAIYDELQDRLQAGDIELRVVDKTDRVLICRYRDRTLTPLPPQFLATVVRVSFTLEALDPIWYDRDPLPASGPATVRVRIQVGTAPTWPLIHLLGAAVNPVITLRNAAGDVVSSMTLTVTLAATDYLVIDCAAGTITKYASGVASDGLALLTAGDFPVLSPENADFVSGSMPSLEVSAGSFVAFYRRGYA